jgi:hypothetical protein
VTAPRSPDNRLLDGAQIRDLLIDLGLRLHARGVEARIFLVGGAAMALAFSRDRVTRDLDAVFEPKQEIYAEVARIARERRLPAGWLNDAVKGLLPDRQPPLEGVGSFSAEGIQVGVASAEYLFAMKAMAARQETDGDDLRQLVQVLGIGSVDAALDLVERFYGPGQLGPKTQLILQDVMSAATAKPKDPRAKRRPDPGSAR